MNSTLALLGAGACLLVACHGPPLMSRVAPQPLAAQPASGAERGSALRAPFLDAEASASRVLDGAALQRIEAAWALRRSAHAPPPPSLIELARKEVRRAREKGEDCDPIELDLCRLWKLLRGR